MGGVLYFLFRERNKKRTRFKLYVAAVNAVFMIVFYFEVHLSCRDTSDTPVVCKGTAVMYQVPYHIYCNLDSASLDELFILNMLLLWLFGRSISRGFAQRRCYCRGKSSDIPARP